MYLGFIYVLTIYIEYLTYDVIEIIPTWSAGPITLIVDENFAFQRKPKKTSHSQRFINKERWVHWAQIVNNFSGGGGIRFISPSLPPW